MALDEPKESDFTFTDRGIQYLVDKDLFEEVKPITVDFKKSFMSTGFELRSSLSNKKGAGDGCCG
jgi:Fe-S cluster assembly iron-binding protein IscA